MKPFFISVVAAGAVVVSASGAAGKSERKPLLPQAPEKYVRMANPFAKDPEAYNTGEKIYRSKCARCHEPENDADRGAPSLNVLEVKTAAPGSIYWVLEKGSSDMPSFSRYPEKYRWHLVTFLQERK
jgi:mono/diheme cytochrome c family protein